MNEIAYEPPFELRKTDHGIDGWDAKTWVIAKFTTKQKALDYLAERGFTHKQWNSYYHKDEAKRNTMGAISYEIREVSRSIPTDPE